MPRLRPRRTDERGSVTVQLTMLLPVLLMLVWVALGAAMVHYGRTAALSAAQSGATAAAAEHGTTAACRTAAMDLLGRVGDAISDVTVTCQLAATTSSATITGATLSLVPGWTPTVTETAVVARERLT